MFDGRKPTGGKLEVKIRLREPLNGQDLQTVTEKWLVMDPVTRKVMTSVCLDGACPVRQENLLALQKSVPLGEKETRVMSGGFFQWRN